MGDSIGSISSFEEELICDDGAFVEGLWISLGYWIDCMGVLCTDGSPCTLKVQRMPAGNSTNYPMVTNYPVTVESLLAAGRYVWDTGDILAALSVSCSDEGVTDMEGPYG